MASCTRLANAIFTFCTAENKVCASVLDAIKQIKRQDVPIAGMDSWFSQGSAIGYQPIFENEDHFIGVFTIPPGAKIPLHNHPEMVVLSLVLTGSIYVESFDIPCNEDFLFLGGECRKSVDETFSEMSLLYTSPHERNIHQFTCMGDGPCSILDFISPCYNHNRPCTYFEASSEGTDTDVAFLNPIPEPQDFFTQTLVFPLSRQLQRELARIWTH